MPERKVMDEMLALARGAQTEDHAHGIRIDAALVGMRNDARIEHGDALERIFVR